MVKLKILIPTGTTNYITNPSFRFDTTGWLAAGSTLTRSLSRARFGMYSGQVVTNGAVLYEGVSFRVSDLAGINDGISISIYVRGGGRVRIRLDDNAPGGQEYISQPLQLTDDRWTRIEVTGQSHGGNDLRLYVETDEGLAVARTFYVDGAQMEQLPYCTSYCDGDQEGCLWLGTYHASKSIRSKDTRSGGRWVQISGEEREAEDLYMTVAGGLGVAPLTNNVQSFSLSPGGFHQNVKIGMRLITFTFHAKKVNILGDVPVSLDHLHELRQMLIDVVKPDLTGGDENIWFEYQDGTIPLFFQARYDGGLEGEWDVRNSFVNSFPLRLLAVNPFFDEDDQEAAELDIQEEIGISSVASRNNGEWDVLNYGFNSEPFDFALGPRGEIYAGGSFTLVNNNAAAINPTLPAAVAYWDGSSWVPIASTKTGNFVNALAVGQDGKVYAGGDFTALGGVAVNRIAYWDGSTWNALGTGLNGICNSIVVAKNGDIYAAGDFTTAGGISSNRVARWDGSQWTRVGQYGGLNNNVEDLAMDINSNILYACGIFTDENGNPGTGLTRVAKYNIETGIFSAMGAGVDAQANAMAVSKSGDVFVGGVFILSGSTTVNCIAKWNGSSWEAMGSGFTFSLGQETVWDIAVYDNGSVVAVGAFDKSGDRNVKGLGLWNGSNWTPFDFNLRVGTVTWGQSVFINNKTQNLYVGVRHNNVEKILVSDINEIENTGSAKSPVNIYISGAGRLVYLENQSTHKRIYFDLYVESSEEVIIDLRNKTVTSSTQGDKINTVISGSDFQSFNLLPGTNEIACLLVDDVGAKMSIQYTPRHWSMDATGRGDQL